MKLLETIETIRKQLAEPFPSGRIKWRVGATNDRNNPTKGMPLAYLDARDVMDRLDDTFGVDGWTSIFDETATNRVLCRLTCRFPADNSEGEVWVTKSDGAGATDMEGEKGAISDALKRAAVSFGIGRYLYRLPNQWVPVEKRGKSTYIKKGCIPELPQWALPADERTVSRKKAAPKGATKDEASDAQVEAFLEVYREQNGLLMDYMKTDECDGVIDEIIRKHAGEVLNTTELAATKDRTLFKHIFKDLKAAVAEAKKNG